MRHVALLVMVLLSSCATIRPEVASLAERMMMEPIDRETLIARREAFLELLSIGGKDVVDVLVDCFADDDRRNLWGVDFWRVDSSALPEDADERICRHLLGVILSDPNPQRRVAGLRVVFGLHLSSMIPQIRPLIHDNDSNVAAAAIEVLAVLHDATIVDNLLANVEHYDCWDWEVVQASICALGYLEESSAVTLLMDTVKVPPSLRVRFRRGIGPFGLLTQPAWVALARIADTRSKQLFQEALRNPETATFVHAWGLLRLGEEEGRQFLVDYLNVVDEDTCLSRLRDVAQTEDPLVIPLLEPFLSDEREKVRVLAEAAIDAIRNPTWDRQGIRHRVVVTTIP